MEKLHRISLNDFEGKTFINGFGNSYKVERGRFLFENKSAEIDLISALDEIYYLHLLSSRPDATSRIFKDKLEYWIKCSYHFPKQGDYIAVTFTDAYARENQRWGYVTSPIKEIQRMQ